MNLLIMMTWLKISLSTCKRQIGVSGAKAVVDIKWDVSWQAAQHDLETVIGQPRVASWVQDEEVRGIGYQLARLIYPGDGGGGVGANQCKQHQGDPRVSGLAVVGVDSQNLRLDCKWVSELLGYYIKLLNDKLSLTSIGSLGLDDMLNQSFNMIWTCFSSLTLNIKDDSGIVALSALWVRGSTHQLTVPLPGPESECAVSLRTVLHWSFVMWRCHHQTSRPATTWNLALSLTIEVPGKQGWGLWTPALWLAIEAVSDVFLHSDLRVLASIDLGGRVQCSCMAYIK